MSAHATRLRLHFAALVVECLGTVFLFLDILRLNSRAPADALGVIGDLRQYRHWYFHAAPLGFALVFVGILLAGLCLWLEHKAMRLAEPTAQHY